MLFKASTGFVAEIAADMLSTAAMQFCSVHSAVKLNPDVVAHSDRGAPSRAVHISVIPATSLVHLATAELLTSHSAAPAQA